MGLAQGHNIAHNARGQCFILSDEVIYFSFWKSVTVQEHLFDNYI